MLRSDASPLTAGDVEFLYRELLGREPAPAEVGHQIANAPGLRELLTAVLHSDEYRQRAAAQGRPVPVPSVVNVFTEELAPYGHPPGRWSADGVAVMGRAGWLFLGGGTNAILAQYRDEVVLPVGWDELWADALEIRRREAMACGAQLLVLTVPDKLSVLMEHFPEDLPLEVVPPAARLARRPELDVHYPVQALRAVRGGAYLRTDTHLSYDGNAALAATLGHQLGVPTPVRPSDTMPATVISGDLGSRFVPPVVEIVRTAGDLGAAEIIEDNHDEIATVGGHIGTRRIFSNSGAADPRTVVLFGDSYGFSAPHYQGLSWFLAQWFREVHFVWVPFGWDPDYVADVGASVVVCQGAERFVVRPPAARVDARDLARQTIARRRGIPVEELGSR